MPNADANSIRRAVIGIALACLPWCVGAVPVTMIFTSSVIESVAGPGIRPLSGVVRLTYTFDSDLPIGSGPIPMAPGLASYGPISATLQFLGGSFGLPLNTGITVFQLPHGYAVGGQAQGVTIDGTSYANVSFGFLLSDDDQNVFTQLALPLDTSFVSGIDRFQVSLVADGRSASGIGPPAAFTLAVPENGAAGMMTLGLLVLGGLQRRDRNRSFRRSV